MQRNTKIPIIKPTETEKRIWGHIHLRKIGGLIRQGSTKSPSKLFPEYYKPRDKTNPDDWENKMKGGPRAEWWAYMMEDAHRILDVGCGFGFPSFYLASCGHEVVGIDPSPSQIAEAERYRQEEGAKYNLAYKVVKQTVLPFEDNTFDGATLGHSLECAGDPETLMSEVIRVLKPNSPVAIDEEDRATQPKTHPVWEDLEIVIIDGISYLRVETRVCNPYFDRRYMIKLEEKGRSTGHLRKQAPTDSRSYWSISLKETGLSLEQVLSESLGGEYGEAAGYDAYTLKDFLEKIGFTDLKFWIYNSGQKFAEELRAMGVLAAMPHDINAVCRALVRSIPPLSTPTTTVSCRSPQFRTRRGKRNVELDWRGFTTS